MGLLPLRTPARRYEAEFYEIGQPVILYSIYILPIPDLQGVARECSEITYSWLLRLLLCRSRCRQRITGRSSRARNRRCR